jgi:hypothetical protein
MMIMWSEHKMYEYTNFMHRYFTYFKLKHRTVAVTMCSIVGQCKHFKPATTCARGGRIVMVMMLLAIVKISHCMQLEVTKS